MGNPSARVLVDYRVNVCPTIFGINASSPGECKINPGALGQQDIGYGKALYVQVSLHSCREPIGSIDHDSDKVVHTS